MEDELQLLKNIKEGDEEAFRIFFNTTYPSLFSYVMTYVKNKLAADDITQQAFIKFWTKRDKINLKEAPRGYLFTIAQNIFLDQKRKKNVEVYFIDNIVKDTIAEEHYDQQKLEEKLIRLKEVIEDLPHKCKQILIMNKIEGFKYKEIADILGISIKTVESQMRIAFNKIRKAFKNNTMIVLFFQLKKKGYKF